MLDVSLTLKTGLAIGGLISVPLITKTLAETGPKKHVVHRSGDLIGPIFDCYKDENNYQVYLVPNLDKLRRNEELDESFTLRIVEKGGSKSEQIVWDASRNDNKWNQWDIHFLNGTVKLLNSGSVVEGFEQFPTCLNRKVNLKDDRNNGTFWSVTDKETSKKINFKVDWEACKSSEECDIVFAKGNIFEWSAGFKPKISIPSEKR